MSKINIHEIRTFVKDGIYKTFTSSENRCLVCDAELEGIHDYVCSDCKERLSLKYHNKCKVCGRLSRESTCRYCRENKKPYEKICAVFEYAEPIDGFINEFKEQGNTIYGRMFVKTLLENYDNFNIHNIDLITSVPANKIRKISRLRDAPKYFAKALSKHINVEYVGNCLQRKGFAKAMRKKSGKQRMEVANKSYIIGKQDLINKNILLVDDVFTTGATTHVCTNLLLENGAKSVTILAMVCVNSR